MRVEADISDGFPGIDLVGYLGNEVREAKERVWTAVRNSGFLIPQKKVTINFSPANIKKNGTGFDLAVAIGLLQATEVIGEVLTEDTIICGELMLSGEVGRIRGVLPIVKLAKEMGMKRCIIPRGNAAEGASIKGIDVIAVDSLIETVKFLQGDLYIEPEPLISEAFLNELDEAEYDFKDVQGQNEAKRGMEIAAAGGHNLLMSGSPGAGKTLLSKCFMSILPPLELEEAIELTKIYSISGLLDKENPLITKRPFRPVHHSASAVGIIGGGSNPKPGEISLAHRGVLNLIFGLFEYGRNRDIWAF